MLITLYSQRKSLVHCSFMPRLHMAWVCGWVHCKYKLVMTPTGTGVGDKVRLVSRQLQYVWYK